MDLSEETTVLAIVDIPIAIQSDDTQLWSNQVEYLLR